MSHLQDGARLVPWGLVCLGARDRQEVAERVRATDPEPVVDSIALLAAYTRQSDNPAVIDAVVNGFDLPSQR